MIRQMNLILGPTSSQDALLTQGVLARRFLALVVDGICITVLGWLLAFGITVLGFLTLGLGWLAFHIIPWLPLLYYTLLIGSEGATPGQRAMGIAVRQEADLSPPSMAQALVWALLLGVSFALGCVPFALGLVSQRHRMAHDVLAGLVVIRHPQISY